MLQDNKETGLEVNTGKTNWWSSSLRVVCGMVPSYVSVVYEVHINSITFKEWEQLHENLWTSKKQEVFKLANNGKNIYSISLEELLIVLKHFKNKNSRLKWN